MLVKLYDAILAEAAKPASKEMYTPAGRPRRGAAHRCAFWDGYLGVRSPNAIPGSLSGVCYEAGLAFAKTNPGIEHADAMTYVFGRNARP